MRASQSQQGNGQRSVAINQWANVSGERSYNPVFFFFLMEHVIFALRRVYAVDLYECKVFQIYNVILASKPFTELCTRHSASAQCRKVAWMFYSPPCKHSTAKITYTSTRMQCHYLTMLTLHEMRPTMQYEITFSPIYFSVPLKSIKWT